MAQEEIKLDLGCGRMKRHGFVGIDKVQCVDGNGKEIVDLILDLETAKLPQADSSVSEVAAFSFLEHVENLQNVLNEAWRVLKPDGFIFGAVPVCGTQSHYRDPTHKRCFIQTTFDYFCGESIWKKDAPSHPRYADYGFKPWDMVHLFKSMDGEMIHFKMKPRK